MKESSKHSFVCAVCGAIEFSFNDVLWPSLISEWELSEEEAAYINRQQGMCCAQCGNNLRSIALADAIISSYRFSGVLIDFVKSEPAEVLDVLEVNEAGGLSSILSGFPRHKLIEFPEVDMMGLPLGDETYDVIVHSDTLEHIPDPVLALQECYRILKPGSVCIFTVPIIVGRQTRSRKGMVRSYHGSVSDTSMDLTVHYEFGSDVWEFVALAGFRSITAHIFEYPAAIAIIAKK